MLGPSAPECSVHPVGERHAMQIQASFCWLEPVGERL